MTRPAAVNVTVLLADATPARVKSAVARLKSAGLQVSDVHDAIGAVSGSIAAGKLEALKQIPGVQAVEEAQEFQINPPDSEKQ